MWSQRKKVDARPENEEDLNIIKIRIRLIIFKENHSFGWGTIYNFVLSFLFVCEKPDSSICLFPIIVEQLQLQATILRNISTKKL